MKTALFLCAISLCLSGCYTQFATLDYSQNNETYTASDSLQSVQRQSTQPIRDTIVILEHRNCYWTRDFWGRPQLKCYTGSYPDDWYSFNRLPWWSRNYDRRFDMIHCLPDYYFDPECGNCRYSRDWTRSYYPPRPRNGQAYPYGQQPPPPAPPVYSTPTEVRQPGAMQGRASSGSAASTIHPVQQPASVQTIHPVVATPKVTPEQPAAPQIQTVPIVNPVVDDTSTTPAADNVIRLKPKSQVGRR